MKTVWRVLALTALTGVAGFAGVSAAQPPGQPGGSGSISFPPGEQLSPGSTTLVAGSGSVGGSINFSANCPEPSPPPTLGNFWGLQAGLADQYDNHQGNDYFVGPNQSTYTNSLPFSVSLPNGVNSDTWTWSVTLGCDGESTTIASGSFTVERCDPDAYDKAQSEYQAALTAEKAGFDDLAKADKEIQQFIKDYIADSVHIIPEKADALEILKLISEDIAYRTEVTGLVVGLSITAEQLESLRQDYQRLSDSAKQEFDLAQQLESEANLNERRALTGGCPDKVHDQLKKIKDDAELTEKAQALIDTWTLDGYTYLSPITHEVVDEVTALKQAKAVLTSGASHDVRANSVTESTASGEPTAADLRAVIRYLDDALAFDRKATHQLTILQRATETAVTRLKPLLG